MNGHLLDTNVLIRWGAGDGLGSAADQVVETSPRLMVSDVSMWELAIKARVGKLDLDLPVDIWFDRALSQPAVSSLPIERRCIGRVATLPLHHRDPFDRLLIAQAQVEGLTVITSDRKFRLYGIDVLEAAS